MTTKIQAREIFRPLMGRHPHLKNTSTRYLCTVPVRHFASGIFIERTSHRDYLSPWWAVTALFRPKTISPFSMGTYREYLSRPNEQFWLWSDPTMIAEAIDVIETVALPKLAFYGTLEGYATLPLRDQWAYYEPREDRMLVHIAMGDLDAAREILRAQEPTYRGNVYPPNSLLHRWQTQLAAVAEPLLAGDRPALARILHDWEANTVRGTELERYWQPTPFPLES